jgi:hypothetical protein
LDSPLLVYSPNLQFYNVCGTFNEAYDEIDTVPLVQGYPTISFGPISVHIHEQQSKHDDLKESVLHLLFIYVIPLLLSYLPKLHPVCLPVLRPIFWPSYQLIILVIMLMI